MTTMLERAARALCSEESKMLALDADRAWAANRTQYRKKVRAVLMAVREPDERTLVAGYVIRSTDGKFTAMIDAILNEAPK